MALDLADKVVALHRAFDAAQLSHAFGGALALAWCTTEVRNTIDVDINVFVPTDRAANALAALPHGVTYTDTELDLLTRDGQVRVRWDHTPVDLFLNTTDYHEQVAERIRRQPFMGEMMPYLACDDLAVFKAFFNRTKDWADLEAMIEANRLDATAVLGTLTLYLGGDDERIARLRGLVTELG